ncbi:hypothetical protein ACFLW6_00805 [Chloroflexota bacterium]
MNFSMPEEEEMSIEESQTRWLIDLDWYRQNNRSLYMLARSHICPECTKKLGAEGKEASEDKLLATMRDCCSRSPVFITEQTPILESIFCLFLANGNQSLNLEEIGKQLNERWGGDAYRTSPELLSRLLRHDCYYGVREIKDQPS